MADYEKEGRTRRPLTYDDRVAIEHGLNRGDRIAWIARSIGRTQHVVAEEVKRARSGGFARRCAQRLAESAATGSATRFARTSSARRARSWSIRPSAATRAISGKATDAPTCTASTRLSTPRIWRMPAEARPEAA